jgi:hypothetical protein
MVVAKQHNVLFVVNKKVAKIIKLLCVVFVKTCFALVLGCSLCYIRQKGAPNIKR